MMVPISAPYDTASALPRATSPRMRIRTRQSIRELKNDVHSQASSIEGAVSWPSKLLVTSRMGMRISDGKRPK